MEPEVVPKGVFDGIGHLVRGGDRHLAGDGDGELREPLVAGAAGTERSFVTLAPPHDGQVTLVSERTRVSKRASQAEH